MYTPDSWIIVKINGIDPHYRIFGGWNERYTQGASWRLNSGIVQCIEEGDSYEFYGFSGSVYVVKKDSYNRLDLYNRGVIESYCDGSAGTMEILEEVPKDLENFDWIIKRI
jgi:hypothetical protein